MKRRKLISKLVLVLAFDLAFCNVQVNACSTSHKMRPNISQNFNKLNVNNNFDKNNDLNKAYTPSQIKQAYDMDMILSEGEEQNIAVVVAYGNDDIKDDLQIFSKRYNLEDASLNIVYPNGKPSNENPNVMWALETSIDVEWIHALASKAKITLVVAKSEVAWANSGGGISKYEVQPKYQKDYGLNTQSNRSIPDVSFCASTNTGISAYLHDYGWIATQGTSFSAPAWAAFIARVNSGRGSCMNNLHNKLYKIAKSFKYGLDFRDIKSGANGEDSSAKAHKGYDYVTGLGSPNMIDLYYDLM